MGGLAKAAGGLFGSFFGGGSGSQMQATAMPVPPPIAPPAYSAPQQGTAAGNVSNSARAAGAFSDTIITGPEGLKDKQNTSSAQLKTTTGS